MKDKTQVRIRYAINYMHNEIKQETNDINLNTIVLYLNDKMLVNAGLWIFASLLTTHAQT